MADRLWWDPPPQLQWEVYPVDKKGKACGSPVYVRAVDEQRALACGKYWRRVLSLKGGKKIVARRYHPESDPSMSAWIKKT